MHDLVTFVSCTGYTPIKVLEAYAKEFIKDCVENLNKRVNEDVKDKFKVDFKLDASLGNRDVSALLKNPNLFTQLGEQIYQLKVDIVFDNDELTKA